MKPRAIHPHSGWFTASRAYGAEGRLKPLMGETRTIADAGFSQCVIKRHDSVSKGISGLIVCLERPNVPNIFTVKHLAMSFTHVLKEIGLVRRT